MKCPAPRKAALKCDETLPARRPSSTSGARALRAGDCGVALRLRGNQFHRFGKVRRKAGFMTLQNIRFPSMTAERYAGKREIPFQVAREIIASAIRKSDVADQNVKLAMG
jgi:hypothetical protein